MPRNGRQGQGAAKVSDGGAEGGAKVRFCEGILRCTQPKSLSLNLSPRYLTKRA